MAPASSADALTASHPTPAQTLRLGRHADRRPLAALPAVQLALASAAGVLLGSYFRLSIVAWTGGFVGALVAASLGSRLASIARLTPTAPLVAAAVSFAMAAWTTVNHASAPPSELARSAPPDWAPVVLRGTIDGPVELRPSGLAQLPGRDRLPAEQSVFPLRIEEIRDGTRWRPLAGRLAVVVQEMSPGGCLATASTSTATGNGLHRRETREKRICDRTTRAGKSTPVCASTHPIVCRC